MRRITRPAVLFASTALVLGVTGGVAQASSDYDGLMPTWNLDHVCIGVGGDLNNPSVHVCQTDNKDVYWYYDQSDPGELESNDVATLTNVLATQYGTPTHLDMHYDSTPVWSGSGQTDLIFQEAESGLAIPADLLGITWCDSATSPTADGYRCDQTWIRIVGGGYLAAQGSIACHEVGHAVGLVHGIDASFNASPHLPVPDGDVARLGCMVQGTEAFPPNTTASAREQINVQY